VIGGNAMTVSTLTTSGNAIISGNVGIGITNPTYALQLATASTINLGNALTTNINTTTVTAATPSAINVTYNGTISGPSGGAYTFTTNSASNGGFQIASGLTIGACYNVSIRAYGTLTNFQISDNNSVNYVIISLTGSYNTYTSTFKVITNSELWIQGITAGNGLTIVYNNITVQRLDTLVTGNVGIGGNVGINYNVDSPNYKLVIEQGLGNSSNGLFISNTNYGSMQGFGLSMVHNGLYSYATIQGYTSGVAAVVPLCLQPTSGNVGIGTNNPGSKLTVNGGISATSAVNVSGTDTYQTVGLGLSNSTGTATTWQFSVAGSNGPETQGALYIYGNRITVNSGFALVIQPTSGNLHIAGALSKGSGTFDIAHPLYPNTNRRLVHSFIEGPRCDLIYRGIIVLINGSASVYIDKQCTYAPENAMDDGTFEALCANPQYFLQNMSGFNRVIGSIYRGILTITCENNTATDMISWMVVAERKDPFVKNWDRTDSNGYLNTQYMK
jgi:hypothetical protein